MNRKQKKAKRLKATQHTKSQARAYFTPHEEESIKKWQDGQNEWYAMIQSELQPSKPIIRVWHVVVVIIIGVGLWLIMQKQNEILKDTKLKSPNGKPCHAD